MFTPVKVPAPVRWSDTLLTYNRQAKVVRLPVDPDGHVRVSVAFLCAIFNVPEHGVLVPW